MLSYKTKQRLSDALSLGSALLPKNIIRMLLSVSASNRRQYRRVFSIDEFIASNNCRISRPLNAKHLDLGCGVAPKNPFNAESIYGVDKIASRLTNVLQEDIIMNPLPFPNETFHYCSAFDFVEHIPRACIYNDQTIFPFIMLMNEVQRVLKPNGLFVHLTPSFPSPYAFTDPTHVNLITEETFPQYFCGDKPGAKVYGFDGLFELVDQAWVRDIWIAGILKKKAV